MADVRKPKSQRTSMVGKIWGAMNPSSVRNAQTDIRNRLEGNDPNQIQLKNRRKAQGIQSSRTQRSTPRKLG